MNTYEITFSLNGSIFSMIIKTYSGAQQMVAENLAISFGATVSYINDIY